MNSYDDSTHDVSSEDYHVKDIETFGKTLERVAAAAFPKYGYSRYSHVYVLLLSWEADDPGITSFSYIFKMLIGTNACPGVIMEIVELQQVFSKKYRYEAEHWRIPYKGAYNALRKKLNGFLDVYDGETNLLIVYYGGHGFMDQECRCVWSWCVTHAFIASSQGSAFQKTIIIDNDLNLQAFLALAPRTLPHSLDTGCKRTSSKHVRTS